MNVFSTILKDRNLKPMLSFVLFVLVLVMLYLIYDRTLREGARGRRRAYSPTQNDDAAAAAIEATKQKIRAENRLYRQHNFQPSPSGIYSSAYAQRPLPQTPPLGPVRSTSSTSGSDVSAYEQPSGPIYEEIAGTLGPVGGARGKLPDGNNTYDMAPPGQRSATLNRNHAAGASNNTPGHPGLTQTQREQVRFLGFFSI